MPLRLADVKKTVRSRGDGERYIHPKLLSGPSVATQVSLALAYLSSRLGRPRREVDAEALVRFFGDPKVARGLVACLGATYRWTPRHFRDVLDPPALARLAARGIHTPGELRLYLFDGVNAHGHGFLAAPRDDNLATFARRLRLSTARLDQLVALDADENAVLLRVGPTPEPEAVVALYNHSVVDAILRHSARVELDRVGERARAALEGACAAHGVAVSIEGQRAVVRNHADVFGSYARAGQRLTRALYVAAATDPSVLSMGRARVQLPGRTALYPLERETLRALTHGTGRVHCAAPLPDFRATWDRLRVADGPVGWRLLALPEPVVTPAGLAIAPFACQRDDRRVLFWPVTTPDAREGALALRAAGLDLLLLLGDDLPGVAADVPHVRLSDGVAGVVAALRQHWGVERAVPSEQALEGLLVDVGERGFVPEPDVAAALGLVGTDELAGRLATLDDTRAVYLPGLGVCSPIFAAKMHQGLRHKARKARRKRAA